jgi:hypothetical protein
LSHRCIYLGLHTRLWGSENNNFVQVGCAINRENYLDFTIHTGFKHTKSSFSFTGKSYTMFDLHRWDKKSPYRKPPIGVHNPYRDVFCPTDVSRSNQSKMLHRFIDLHDCCSVLVFVLEYFSATGQSLLDR